MKENSVAKSFFVANLADVGSTIIGVRLGMQEIGGVAGPMIESGNEEVFYLLKMGITAGLIGIYLLSQEKGGRLGYVVGNSVRILNILTWGVIALNTVQIVGKVMS